MLPAKDSIVMVVIVYTCSVTCCQRMGVPCQPFASLGDGADNCRYNTFAGWDSLGGLEDHAFFWTYMYNLRHWQQAC